MDPLKEPPLVTANTIMSILAVDYPVDKVFCYVSDDGVAMLTFEALSETSKFARRWVLFCKKFSIESRALEWNFAQKVDYLKDKVHSEFCQGGYVGGFGYQQPVSYNYQQGFMYPSYGYAAYGPEYVYPQGVYNPYPSRQYLPIYGVSVTVNTVIYPYGQLGQTLPSSRGYTTVQGYAMPGHQFMQFGGPSVNAISTSPIPTIQGPYPIVYFLDEIACKPAVHL